MLLIISILANHSTSFLSIWPRDKADSFGGKFACFEDGDKFGYSTTEPLRATATKLGSCDKHSVYCQELGSVFPMFCDCSSAVNSLVCAFN